MLTFLTFRSSKTSNHVRNNFLFIRRDKISGSPPIMRALMKGFQALRWQTKEIRHRHRKKILVAPLINRQPLLMNTVPMSLVLLFLPRMLETTARTTSLRTGACATHAGCPMQSLSA